MFPGKTNCRNLQQIAFALDRHSTDKQIELNSRIEKHRQNESDFSFHCSEVVTIKVLRGRVTQLSSFILFREDRISDDLPQSYKIQKRTAVTSVVTNTVS